MLLCIVGNKICCYKRYRRGENKIKRGVEGKKIVSVVFKGTKGEQQMFVML